MKVLHINDTYCNLGGSEKYLLNLCNALEERGNEIIIISSSENEHISVNGRREYFVKPSYGIRSGLKMWSVYRDIVEKENPDLIHVHNTQHNDEHFFVSPLIIQRLSKLKPTVKFVHDARFFCPNAGRKVTTSLNEICNYPVGKYCLNKKGCHLFALDYNRSFDNLHKFFLVCYDLWVSKMMNRTIVASQYMCDELIKNGLPKDKISIIPCFTEKAVDREEIINKQNGLILYVGRLHKGKGIRQFIEALSNMKDKQWRAEIVGDGELFQELQKRVEALGLKERVKSLGWLSNGEIDDCYQRCSMVIMPSMFPESFGLVGIEAMAVGKPVVAFDAGGVKDWLIDGETGYLVERGDIKGLATKISRLLDDEELAKRMGVKALKNVDKFYRKDLHLKKLIRIYEEVIKERINYPN